LFKDELYSAVLFEVQAIQVVFSFNHIKSNRWLWSKISLHVSNLFKI